MRVDNLEAVGGRPRKRRDEVAEFVHEKREVSIRMEQQMARPRIDRRSTEHPPRRIFDNLIKPEVDYAVALPVWHRNRLMAMRFVLARQIRSASGMLVLHDLSESPVLDFDGARKSANVVGEGNALAVLFILGLCNVV
jgi:hypothetical protein